MEEFTAEKIELLKNTNLKLNIYDNLTIERNRNLIVVYTPPKVGSTSLVSSLRLYLSTKYTIVHLHNEKILKLLFGIDGITINEIIRFNRLLGKNVYVFDIFRTPIEHKISVFFQDIKDHFNNTEENINKYNVSKLIRRFNNIYCHLKKKDYYKDVYDIDFPVSFDFEKKYVKVEKENIKYIKLRLNDSFVWQNIIREILNEEVKIIKDYETEKKKIGEIYRIFMNEYKIPANYFEEEMQNLNYYMQEGEIEEYKEKWSLKRINENYEGYSSSEYKLYLEISAENNSIITIESEHYMDIGCPCNSCKRKREEIKDKIENGVENIDTKVEHNIAEIKRDLMSDYISKKKSIMSKVCEEVVRNEMLKNEEKKRKSAIIRNGMRSMVGMR